MVHGTDLQSVGDLQRGFERGASLLPESYETSEDGLTITFKIPADAKFSNGDPLDGSRKRIADRFLTISQYTEDLGSVESIEAVDETTVVFHLSQAAPYMGKSDQHLRRIIDIDYAGGGRQRWRHSTARLFQTVCTM